MRLYGIRVADIATVIAAPTVREVDERGNARFTGVADDGRRILIVVAGDEPDFVITVFPRS
jgi:hypothetical protein